MPKLNLLCARANNSSLLKKICNRNRREVVICNSASILFNTKIIILHVDVETDVVKKHQKDKGSACFSIKIKCELLV